MAAATGVVLQRAAGLVPANVLGRAQQGTAFALILMIGLMVGMFVDRGKNFDKHLPDAGCPRPRRLPPCTNGAATSISTTLSTGVVGRTVTPVLSLFCTRGLWLPDPEVRTHACTFGEFPQFHGLHAGLSVQHSVVSTRRVKRGAYFRGHVAMKIAPQLRDFDIGVHPRKGRGHLHRLL